MFKVYFYFNKEKIEKYVNWFFFFLCLILVKQLIEQYAPCNANTISIHHSKGYETVLSTSIQWKLTVCWMWVSSTTRQWAKPWWRLFSWSLQWRSFPWLVCQLADIGDTNIIFGMNVEKLYVKKEVDPTEDAHTSPLQRNSWIATFSLSNQFRKIT